MAQPSTEIWKKLTQTQRDELVRDVGLDANGETDDDLTRMITAHHLQKIQLFSTKRAFRKLLESHGWVHQTDINSSTFNSVASRQYFLRGASILALIMALIYQKEEMKPNY
eukprot:590040_1